MDILQKIRQKIVERKYYLSVHAEEEMWVDGLERKDVEYAILKGRVEKKLTQDARGTRYRMKGTAIDGRPIHIVCRFNEKSELLIITVYALEVEE